ncbi:MAG: hypothetical protein ACOC3D_03805 [Pseudomonadota bacterium]
MRTDRLSQRDRLRLWWAAPPLLVLLLAHLLFELVGAAYADLGLELADATAAAAPETVLRGGFGWAATTLVYLAVGLGSAVATMHILRAHVRGRAARPFRWLAGLIILGGLGHLLVVDGLGLPLGAIFHVTLRALEGAALVDGWRVQGIAAVVGLINVMSVAVPALIVTAAAASALPPIEGWSEESLAQRAREVRQVVMVAAAFMVAGVFHMGAWTHWASALAGAPALEALATTVTLFWGAAFTLMIASFYLPMAAVLRHLAEAEAVRRAVPLAERDAWLKARGLSFEIQRQLPQLAAMSAPLLAGPLSEALRLSVGQFGL